MTTRRDQFGPHGEPDPWSIHEPDGVLDDVDQMLDDEDEALLAEAMVPMSDERRRALVAMAQRNVPRPRRRRWLVLTAPPLLAAGIAFAVFNTSFRDDAPPAAPPLPPLLADWAPSATERGLAPPPASKGEPLSIPLGNLLTVRLHPEGAASSLGHVRAGLFGAEGFSSLEHVRRNPDGSLTVIVPVRDVRASPGPAIVRLMVGPRDAPIPLTIDEPGWVAVQRRLIITAEPR